MSASYVAVGWNRQKKLYDWLIAAFCISFLILFGALNFIFTENITIETLIIRSFSSLALLLLHVILAIGPLTRLNKKFMPLLYNRRHLGVTMFTVALIHGAYSINWFHGASNTNPLVSLFISNTNYDSFPAFPFQALGFFALVIFFIMAITSHDFWLHNLSPRIWKTIHMLVYLAYLLVVMHVMLGVVQLEKNPIFVLLVLGGAATLITLHLLAAIKERKVDQMKFSLQQDGYAYVCDVNDIEESRAKIFCVGKERIAVYKHEGKLYGIHNVCKHQGGPLGEGKIVDGCITCPWHGYQYLPKNGQSPPPFTEKVSTYDVKVVDGKVWLNPVPYPDGTERPGAIIN